MLCRMPQFIDLPQTEMIKVGDGKRRLSEGHMILTDDWLCHADTAA